METVLACSGKGAHSSLPKISKPASLQVGSEAIKLRRMHPELLGVARGKSSLGLRTRASKHSTTRKKLDPTWNPDGILTVKIGWMTHCFREPSRTKQNGQLPLAPAFKGKLQGHVCRKLPSSLSHSKSAQVLTDRAMFKQRLQVYNWTQEMIHLASEHISNAQQMQLWSKVLKAPGFQPQPHFATWLMERDICVVAPLAVPAIERLLHVAEALLSMIER